MLLDKFNEAPTKHHLWIDDVFITGILAKRSGVRHRLHLKLPPTKKTKIRKKSFQLPQVDRVGVRLRLGGGEECERAQEEEDHVRPPRRPRQPQEQGRGKSNLTLNPTNNFSWKRISSTSKCIATIILSSNPITLEMTRPNMQLNSRNCSFVDSYAGDKIGLSSPNGM